MKLTERRKALIKKASELEGHLANVRKAKTQLHDRAAEQLDSLHPLHRVVEDQVAANKAGGILGHRWLRTLQVERARILDVLGRKDSSDEP